MIQMLCRFANREAFLAACPAAWDVGMPDPEMPPQDGALVVVGAILDAGTTPDAPSVRRPDNAATMTFQENQRMAKASTAAERSRGFRNRNPGNIDFAPSNKWQGQIGLGDGWLPAGRRRFAAFQSHEYGIRALAMLLTTYQDRHGLRTIRQIVNRWAPGSENDTDAYVRFVDQQLPRHGADDALDLHSDDDARALVVAIIPRELGGNPYDDATIEAGLRLAGLKRPVRTVAAAATTSEGKAALSVASLAAAASVAAPVIQAMGGLPQSVGVVLVIAVAAVAVATVLIRRRDVPT